MAVISEATFDKSRVLAFNKYHNSWLISGEVAKKLPRNEIDTHTGSELVAYGGSELATQIKKERNIKERDYKSVYDFYITLDLIKHRAYTKDMAKAITKAVKDNKYDIDYCKTLLERHEMVVEKTKDSSYPVKVRGLSEFFGQKVFNGTHLICSEYEEGGKYFEQYIKEVEEPKADRPPLKMIFMDDY